jgi:competence protein ComEC
MPSLAYPPLTASPQAGEPASQPPAPRLPRPRDRPPETPADRKTQPLSFAAAPALFAACCFAAGILAAHGLYQPPIFELLALLTAAILTAAASRFALRAVLVPLGCVWLVLGMACADVEPAPDPQTALIAHAGRDPELVTGRVVRIGPARIEQSTAPFSNKVTEEYSQQIDLAVVSIVAVPVHSHSRSPDVSTVTSGGPGPDQIRGGIRVTVYAATASLLPSVACGMPVKVSTAIHQPDRFLDPGVWDSRAWMLAQGIAVVGSAKSDELNILHDATPIPPLTREVAFRCRLQAIQQSASNRLIAFAASENPRIPAVLRLNQDDAAMLSAMIAGDRTWLDRRIRIGFERTGSFHLLVVSGLHLAIFAGLVFWTARRLRFPRILTTAVTIALSFAYALGTGFGQPVQRSFWMVTLFLIARLLWRDRNSLNAIGFAALCLLAANPRALFDAGFQMTCSRS